MSEKPLYSGVSLVCVSLNTGFMGIYKRHIEKIKVFVKRKSLSYLDSYLHFELLNCYLRFANVDCPTLRLDKIPRHYL